MFAKIRKLVAAVVGLLAVVAYQQFGIDFTGLEQPIVEAVIVVLTAFGVYRLPNDPPDELSSR